MSEKEKPSRIDNELAGFTKRFEEALRKERKQRAKERAEDRKQRAKDNKAYDAKLDKERQQRAEDNKAYDAKLDKERQQRAEDNKAYDAKLDKERQQRAEDQKAFDAKLEKHRREAAVEIGSIRAMWGQLAEFVVESGILDTLNRLDDLSVAHTLPNIAVRYRNEDGKLEHGEFDIIVTGKRDIVVVETKTTLEVHDVNYFVEKYLRQYSRWEASSPFINLPSCEGMRIIGCLAYMKAGSERAEEIAVEHGLITVHVFGDSSDLAHPDTALIDYHPDSYRR